jgi:endonuclease IV
MTIKEKIKGIFTLKNYINLDVLKVEIVEEQQRQKEELEQEQKRQKEELKKLKKQKKKALIK